MPVSTTAFAFPPPPPLAQQPRHYGAWSRMPTIGIVRWRRATEALSPLKTDGLTPRFVSDEQDGRAIKGAWLEPAGADGPGAFVRKHTEMPPAWSCGG